MERRLGTQVANQATRLGCGSSQAKEPSRTFGNATIRFQIKGSYLML